MTDADITLSVATTCGAGSRSGATIAGDGPPETSTKTTVHPLSRMVIIGRVNFTSEFDQVPGRVRDGTRRKALSFFAAMFASMGTIAALNERADDDEEDEEVDDDDDEDDELDDDEELNGWQGVVIPSVTLISPPPRSGLSQNELSSHP
jgi:hypothetical protein